VRASPDGPLNIAVLKSVLPREAAIEPNSALALGLLASLCGG
jgi:hypothetical protein